MGTLAMTNYKIITFTIRTAVLSAVCIQRFLVVSKSLVYALNSLEIKLRLVMVFPCTVTGKYVVELAGETLWSEEVACGMQVQQGQHGGKHGSGNKWSLCPAKLASCSAAKKVILNYSAFVFVVLR